MIYNLNDIYYINQAIDLWLNEDTSDTIITEEEINNSAERCISDD